MQLNLIGERNNNNKKELSRWGSVLGTLLELAAGDGAGRCCSGLYKAVVVVGQHIHETRVREAIGAKKTETELLELGLGRAVENVGGGRWGKMVGRPV